MQFFSSISIQVRSWSWS